MRGTKIPDEQIARVKELNAQALTDRAIADIMNLPTESVSYIRRRVLGETAGRYKKANPLETPQSKPTMTISEKIAEQRRLGYRSYGAYASALARGEIACGS